MSLVQSSDDLNPQAATFGLKDDWDSFTYRFRLFDSEVRGVVLPFKHFKELKNDIDIQTKNHCIPECLSWKELVLSLKDQIDDDMMIGIEFNPSDHASSHVETTALYDTPFGTLCDFTDVVDHFELRKDLSWDYILYYLNCKDVLKNS